MTFETAEKNIFGFFTLKNRRCQVVKVDSFGGFVHYGFKTVDDNNDWIVGWIPADMIGGTEFSQ